MSSLSILLLTLFALSLLTTSFSDSRKGLRNKHENVLKQLRNSVYYSNRIDPSRVVQISWQPRSGSFCTKAFCLIRSVTTLFLWHIL